MADEVRLIDANALKKAIELFCEDERTNMTVIAYFALMELVDTMLTIEAEPDNGWISVKDRLPDVSTAHASQLVMVFSTNNEYEIYFDVYNSLSGKFMSEAQNGCKVTHWRPLPEPPKGV